MKVSRSRAHELVSDYLENWTAPDGGGLLKYRYVRPPLKRIFPGTADNDNAVIGTALLLYLAHYHGILDKRISDVFIEGVRLRTVEPGLYNRNPGQDKRHESWDNYCAISAGSALLDAVLENPPNFAADIVEYGEKNAYHFNNVDPGEYRLRSWKKGGEIAQYKINATYIPTYWELAWLWLHVIKNAFNKHVDKRGRFRLKTDTKFLMWLKLRSLEFTRYDKGWRWINQITDLVTVFWDWRLRKKGGLHKFIKAYYGGHKPENPLVELSKGF